MKWHRVLTIVVATLFLCGVPPTLSGQQNQGSIRPLRASATFILNSKSQPWSAYVYSRAGRKLYVFWLFPEIDVNQHLVAVDLMMSKATDKNPDVNLLNPRNWHGLQPFTFAAADLVQGPKRSAYGVVRIVPLQTRGIKVKIELLNASVRPLPDGGYELTKLRLDISVDNVGASRTAYYLNSRGEPTLEILTACGSRCQMECLARAHSS